MKLIVPILFISEIIYASPTFYQTNELTQILDLYNDSEIELIDSDKEIVEKIVFRGKNSILDRKPIYVATAGGPGSNKSQILDEYLQNSGIKDTAVHIDRDHRGIKFMLNTYVDSLNKYSFRNKDTYQTTQQHAYTHWYPAADYITKVLINKAFYENFDIAHGTTSTHDEQERLFQSLKEKGYYIVLLMCGSTDINRSHAIHFRTNVQGFYQISKTNMQKKALKYLNNFKLYFKYSDQILMFWTEKFNEPSKLAAIYSNEGLQIEDKIALRKFVADYGKKQAIYRQLPSWAEIIANNKT